MTKLRHCFALVVASAAAILASGCGSSDTPTVARAGDLGHIHDLVLEPDGDLLVASHTGLYRIEAIDRAVLVGDEQHDLMAMAAQADTLIASGHPSLSLERYQVEGRPPFLGLVRSNDSGQSWHIVDLLGDADFHALVPTDAGLFAAETTGRIWFLDETNGQWSQLGEMEARDLAINPADPTQQLGTDYDEVVWASTDGAMTWNRLARAPALTEIEWISTERIVGVTEDGSVWATDQVDGRWTVTTSLDADVEVEVETFYIDPNGNWWVTLHGGAIFHSTDAGVTWTPAYDPPDRG